MAPNKACGGSTLVAAGKEEVEDGERMRLALAAAAAAATAAPAAEAALEASHRVSSTWLGEVRSGCAKDAVGGVMYTSGREEQDAWCGIMTPCCTGPGAEWLNAMQRCDSSSPRSSFTPAQPLMRWLNEMGGTASETCDSTRTLLSSLSSLAR